MKTTIKKLGVLILTLVTIGFSSCSSDEGSGSSTNDLFINFTLNGTEINISGDARVASAFTGTTLSINADNGETIATSNFVRIALLLPDKTVSSGTYDFSADVFQSGLYHCNLVTGSTSQYLGTGSITITSNDGDTIEGTFSGTTLNPNGSVEHEITNGSFRALN